MGAAASGATGPIGPGGVDPRVVRSRTAILAAAAEVFVERGYLATRLEDVALRAGVARRTIHNLFGSKEQLFRAALTAPLETAASFASHVVAALGEADDVPEALAETAQRLARAVLGGQVVPLRRLLIAEAARFPELAREYYERAPQRVVTALAEALQRCDERGALRVDDPPTAAEHLAFLVIGASLDRSLFDPDGVVPSAAEVDRRVHAGVDAFLRAYGPSQGPNR